MVYCSEQLIHDRYGRLQEIETIVAEKEPGAFLRSLPCVVGLPAERKPVDTRIVECELTHKQRDIYDKLQYELISEVEGGLLVASIPLVKLLRLRQVTLASRVWCTTPKAIWIRSRSTQTVRRKAGHAECVDRETPRT